MLENERDFRIDNIKIIAIFFVVLGHLIEPLILNSTLIKSVYLSIYSFHMPIFVFISGMLSSTDLKDERINKIINSTLVPFFAFTFLYELFGFLLFQKISDYTLNLQPYWILWFLLSLFCWKVMLPFIMKFKYPVVFSIVLAVLAGCVDDVGYFLGVARTIYFLPFFILGYKLSKSPHYLDYLKKIPLIIYLAAIVLNLCFFWNLNEIKHQWLFGSFSYSLLEVENFYAMLTRLLLLSVSMVTLISLFMVTPKKQLKITSLGAKSLYVFVWHGFFIKVCIGLGVFTLLKSFPTVYSLPSLIIIALTITYILSREFVAFYTQKLILQPCAKILMLK